MYVCINITEYIHQYIYIYIYTPICIYIYIHIMHVSRNREAGGAEKLPPALDVGMHVYVCIYIYIHTL